MKMFVPLPDKAIRKGKDGRIGTEEFCYNRETDSYICPAGKRLLYGGKTYMNKGKKYLVYCSDAKVCGFCPLASRCLPPSDYSRRVTRWEHADVIDHHRERMVEDKSRVMGLRGSLVEYPFGTLKVWAGVHHFLMRGLAKCHGEFNLMVLCYNIRRVLKEIGVEDFIAYCRHRKEARGIGV